MCRQEKTLKEWLIGQIKLLPEDGLKYIEKSLIDYMKNKIQK
ncbi:hypothetical protein OYT88_16865 [Sporolactobacillus sp. CQH2019]|nr:hypothetical protein [Sporolactobacillus sp. CQH2019]MDD9150210.1 hypothetical protein [Sporolactobacillus sp. CQH2019]